MEIEQRSWSAMDGWQTMSATPMTAQAQLVLAFGDRTVLTEPEQFHEIQVLYPHAHILLCTSAGEILDTRVRTDSISLTAISFKNATFSFSTASIENASRSESCGATLAAGLAKEGLRHVLLFSDGLHVNGTALVAGLSSGLPDSVTVTGGLAGDGERFQKTLVGLNEPPRDHQVVAIGLYGDDLQIGHGSLGGWESFGPERLITRSKENTLFELDGKPALALYKEYLGDEAADLPASGLLFPLNLKVTEQGVETEVVRTLLAVDEQTQSMTFAGDMPEGSKAMLMKANFDRLVEGARAAAEMTTLAGAADATFALLISCIGRRLVLKERIEEETEAVRSVVGPQTAMAGFYSYGEISPVAATNEQCRLHNQTMTITTFSEKV